MRTLLVDDSEFARRAYRDGLSRSGIDVDVASSAREALARVSRETYVIVSDVMAPRGAMGLSMPAPQRIRSIRSVGTSKTRSDVRPSGALLGSALAGLVTFVAWGGLALAVGMRGRLALAVAVLTGTCTAVMALANALGMLCEPVDASLSLPKTT